jgi:hypothetical protein
LTPQGVGPGELAIAILSPEVKHVGQSGGGGDIVVGTTPVEIKGSNVGGGRWSDAKKAKMDMAGTTRAIADALKKSGTEVEIPDYLGLDFWCNNLRPVIKPRLLGPLCKTIASNLFSQTNTDELAQALQVGNATNIKRMYVKTNFENYKNYAKFKGLMLLDVNSEQFQYFETFDQMNGHIKVGTPYLRAPERDVTPQIELSPNAGAIHMGRFSINPKKDIVGSNDQEVSASVMQFAEKLADDRMITDRAKIEAIALDIMNGLRAKTKKDVIFQDLLKKYPELNRQPQKAATPTAAPVAAQPPTPVEPEATEVEPQPAAPVTATPKPRAISTTPRARRT